MASDDPTAIRSIAVTREDVIAALEATLRSPQTVVLRVTPPFSGRMRARVHEADTGEFVGEGDPVHLDPRDLVADVPAYPEPGETEDEIRAADDVEYTSERHRKWHVEAVEEWRAGITIPERVALETPDGTHEVELKQLG
jgi:mannitol-1-phosphate/altronate dehydrogenase